MANILIILLLTFSLSTLGQTCDTINGKLINCADAIGLRQGHWELTKKKILVSSYGGLGSKEGCRYFEKAEYYPFAKGEYRDNKKVGTWEYYSGDKLANLEREITYYKDGSIKDNNMFEQYKIMISNDTLKVTGQVYHNLDTLILNCQNRNCKILFYNEQELMSFQFNNLDKIEYELLRIKSGVYDREIKMNCPK